MRKALALTAVAVVAAGSFAPAVAAPKPKPKPITASYSVTGAPIPLPLTGSTPVEDASSCMNPEFEGVSTTTKTIKTVGAGTLTVDVAGFTGDWDITIMNDKREMVAAGDGSATPTALTTPGVTEKAVVKFKKASTILIAVCNFLGSPSANVKYAYVYK